MPAITEPAGFLLSSYRTHPLGFTHFKAYLLLRSAHFSLAFCFLPGLGYFRSFTHKVTKKVTQADFFLKELKKIIFHYIDPNKVLERFFYVAYLIIFNWY